MKVTEGERLATMTTTEHIDAEEETEAESEEAVEENQ